MAALVVIEAVAIALLGLLVAGLLRSHAEILRSLHHLGVGVGDEARSAIPVQAAPGVASVRQPGEPFAAAADVAGSTLSGDAVHVGIAATDHVTLLAFLSSGCLTCAGFWDAFRHPDTLGLPDGVRLVIVTRSADEESPSRLSPMAPAGTPVVMSSPAWDDYNVPGSPYFVLVDGRRGGVVGEGAAGEWSQVRSLLAQALGDAGPPPRPGRVAATNPGLAQADAEREARADAELMAAGIHPGHPSLHPPVLDADGEPSS
ncbi:MAG: hypothetical protein QOG03_1878 [Actinomycetota bacterium]|jgi:hypothetical protein|nr:hypothetical protein [Actinomycetota bacterium]